MQIIKMISNNKSNKALYNVKHGGQIVKEIYNMADDQNNEVGRKKNVERKLKMTYSSLFPF